MVGSERLGDLSDKVRTRAKTNGRAERLKSGVGVKKGVGVIDVFSPDVVDTAGEVVVNVVEDG